MASLGRSYLFLYQVHARQVVAQVLRRLSIGILFGPPERIRNTVGGDRVGHQELGQLACIHPVGLAHARKKRGHGARLVAGRVEDVDADAVRLFLILAREIDLLLDHGRLPTDRGGRGGVAADCHTERDGGQQDGRVRDAHLAGGFPGTHQMLLGDVGDFMRQ